ncbi:MAG: hypothetical protein KGR42_00625, partial [Acidobacteria bacterium]|nr:hypothetical protein [Acidobacteriota bacterium]
MLTNSAATAWAQIGYMEYPQDGFPGPNGTQVYTPFWFMEVNGVQGGEVTEQIFLTQNTYSQPVVGQTYNYKVLYDASSNQLTLQLQGLDPYYYNEQTGLFYEVGSYTPSGWVPQLAEVLGEGWDQSSQMVGDQVSPATFAATEYLPNGSSKLQPLNSSSDPAAVLPSLSQIPSDVPIYGIKSETPSEFLVWDWGCPPNTSSFESNTNTLYSYYPGVSSSLSQGMYANTSPAVAPLTNSYAIAFESNSSQLNIYTTGSPGSDFNTNDGMMPGSSPSIIALSGSAYEVAFENSSGNLCTYVSSGDSTSCTNLGMNSATSTPSITD